MPKLAEATLAFHHNVSQLFIQGAREDGQYEVALAIGCVHSELASFVAERAWQGQPAVTFYSQPALRAAVEQEAMHDSLGNDEVVSGSNRQVAKGAPEGSTTLVHEDQFVCVAVYEVAVVIGLGEADSYAYIFIKEQRRASLKRRVMIRAEFGGSQVAPS
jgi:hypothetical protein